MLEGTNCKPFWLIVSMKRADRKIGKRPEVANKWEKLNFRYYLIDLMNSKKSESVEIRAAAWVTI